MTISVLAFNCQRCDPLSENYHLGNGYRAYNPALMRFNCPDNFSPFGAGGINPYVYCAGDPINSSDPSGHISWQAGLSIGLGILGIIGVVFTGGASIAAAGSLSAAIAGASTASLMIGASALVADITGIASAATEQRNPIASARLSWVSFAAGLLSLGMRVAGGARGAIKSEVKQRYIAMGKNARNPVFVGDNVEDLTPAFIFTDDYRNQPRVNILAHGGYVPNVGGSTILVIVPEGTAHLTGYQLAEYLEINGLDFSHYAYARTLICDSANRGPNCFGQGFAQRSGLKTKAFEDTVWINSELDSLVQTWRNSNRADPLLFSADELPGFVMRDLHGLTDAQIMSVGKVAPYISKPRAFDPYPDLMDPYQLKSHR